MQNFSKEQLALIEADLKKLQACHLFSSSKRLLRFMNYLIDATLKGEENRLNQTAIGIDVFDRDASFDSTVDSIVRVEAGRLRNKLREYYEQEGKDALALFELPKGRYGLNIHFSDVASLGQGALVNEGSEPCKSNQHLLSLAILPFELLSKREGDDLLADAITISVIDRIGRSYTFDTVSHHSSFAYKGRYDDARDIAKALVVNHVMEGSMRRSGDRLRFSIAVIDGKSGRQVWSGLYDYDDECDHFTLESLVVEDIVNALGSVSWRLITNAQPVIPDSVATDQQTLLLIFNVNQRNCRLGKEQALRAIADRPESAENYGFLVFHLMQEVIACWSDNPDATRLEALANANRALELDGMNVWAQWGASETLMWLGESARSLRVMESLALLNPDDLFVQGFYGHNLLHTGQVEKGLSIMKEAIAAGPDDTYLPPIHFFCCMAYTLLGRIDEAVAVGEYVCRLITGHPQIILTYANALALSGQHEKAEECLLDALRLNPNLSLARIEEVFQQGFPQPPAAEQLTAGLKQLSWA
jgi:TolB-like protein